MKHVAIDLGGRESQVCIRQEGGDILLERRLQTAGLKRYLKTRPRGRVVVETCTEAFSVADAALAAGHEVRVVPAQLVRWLGVGARGVKNDRTDARVLSEVSCRIDLPSVHIPSQSARDRKSMCGMREGLVECRTKLVNTVRGWLRADARRLPSGDIKTLPRRVRDAVEDPPLFVDRLLTSIEELTKQIAQADTELSALAEVDETCRRLMTVPGVGPVTAMRFAATIDDVGRFANAHQVESFLGLVPGERSSGDRKRITSITKAGSPKMRWALIQACWVARRWFPGDPMVRWAAEVELRRGKRIAIVALARKMAGIMYAILAGRLGLRGAPRCDAADRSDIGRDHRERPEAGCQRADAAKVLNSSCPEAVTARRAERLRRPIARWWMISCNRLRPADGRQHLRHQSANSRLRQLAVRSACLRYRVHVAALRVHAAAVCP